MAILSLPGLALSVFLENENFFRLFHKIPEHSTVTRRPYRRVVNVVILVAVATPWLAENQLVILDPVITQPLCSLFTVFLSPGREETDVVTLVVPLVNLRDRIRIGTRVSHSLRILVLNMLADTPVNIDDEYFPQEPVQSLIHRLCALSLR